MRKVAVVMMALLLCAMFSDSVGARAIYIPESELTQQADLVVSGTVVKLEPTGLAEKLRGMFFGRVMYATIHIEKVIKGNAEGQYVTVEFNSMRTSLEADVQDAQFGLGSKGTAYLKKLPNNNYKALGGWIHGWVK